MKKRVHFLINKQVQNKLILQFIFFMLIFALFIAFELFYTAWPVVSFYIPQSVSSDVYTKILFRLMCFSVPILFVFVGYIIIFTNRIAGPLYRLEKTLDKITQGEDVDIIKLRENDEMKPLISKANDVIVYIKDLKAQKE